MIIRLLIIVITSLRQIIETFTSIDNKEIIMTEAHYRRLLSLFKLATYRNQAENGNDGDSLSIVSKKGKKLAAKTDSSARYTKKSKTILNSEKFLRGDTIKTFLFYVFFVIITVGLNTAFTLTVRQIMDESQDLVSQSDEMLNINSLYITALAALKELQFSEEDYEMYVYPFSEEMREDLGDTLNLQGVTSSFEWAQITQNVYQNNPCEIYQALFETQKQ